MTDIWLLQVDDESVLRNDQQNIVCFSTFLYQTFIMLMKYIDIIVWFLFLCCNRHLIHIRDLESTTCCSRHT